MAWYEPRWFIPGLAHLGWCLSDVLWILRTGIMLSRLQNQKGNRYLSQSVDRDCIQNRTPGQNPGVLKISFGWRRSLILRCYRHYSQAGNLPNLCLFNLCKKLQSHPLLKKMRHFLPNKHILAEEPDRLCRGN